MSLTNGHCVKLLKSTRRNIHLLEFVFSIGLRLSLFRLLRVYIGYLYSIDCCDCDASNIMFHKIYWIRAWLQCS